MHLNLKQLQTDPAAFHLHYWWILTADLASSPTFSPWG